MLVLCRWIPVPATALCEICLWVVLSAPRWSDPWSVRSPCNNWDSENRTCSNTWSTFCCCELARSISCLFTVWRWRVLDTRLSFKSREEDHGVSARYFFRDTALGVHSIHVPTYQKQP
ncbi:unnamed protein product [Scytosiphon promiscuus]